MEEVSYLGEQLFDPSQAPSNLHSSCGSLHLLTVSLAQSGVGCSISGELPNLSATEAHAVRRGSIYAAAVCLQGSHRRIFSVTSAAFSTDTPAGRVPIKDSMNPEIGTVPMLHARKLKSQYDLGREKASALSLIAER